MLHGQIHLFCPRLCHRMCACPLTTENHGLMVRVFKIDAAIQNTFPKCVCGASPPQTGRLLPQIGWLLPRIIRFLLKTRKASSEKHWVHTHISFRNTVQLHLQIFQNCICVLRSCACVFRAAFVTEKQNSNEKVSANTHHF